MPELSDDPHDELGGNWAMLEDMDAEQQRYTYALFAAVGDFIETLLEISEMRGPDRPETVDRAIACIRHNQQLAHTVLRKHGFRPRRALIDE